MYACLFTTPVPHTLGGKKRFARSLELELSMVVSWEKDLGPLDEQASPVFLSFHVLAISDLTMSLARPPQAAECVCF